MPFKSIKSTFTTTFQFYHYQSAILPIKTTITKSHLLFDEDPDPITKPLIMPITSKKSSKKMGLKVVKTSNQTEKQHHTTVSQKRVDSPLSSKASSVTSSEISIPKRQSKNKMMKNIRMSADQIHDHNVDIDNRLTLLYQDMSISDAELERQAAELMKHHIIQTPSEFSSSSSSTSIKSEQMELSSNVLYDGYIAEALLMLEKDGTADVVDILTKAIKLEPLRHESYLALAKMSFAKGEYFTAKQAVVRFMKFPECEKLYRDIESAERAVAVKSTMPPLPKPIKQLMPQALSIRIDEQLTIKVLSPLSEAPKPIPIGENATPSGKMKFQNSCLYQALATTIDISFKLLRETLLQTLVELNLYNDEFYHKVYQMYNGDLDVVMYSALACNVSIYILFDDSVLYIEKLNARGAIVLGYKGDPMSDSVNHWQPISKIVHDEREWRQEHGVTLYRQQIDEIEVETPKPIVHTPYQPSQHELNSPFGYYPEYAIESLGGPHVPTYIPCSSSINEMGDANDNKDEELTNDTIIQCPPKPELHSIERIIKSQPEWKYSLITSNCQSFPQVAEKSIIVPEISEYEKDKYNNQTQHEEKEELLEPIVTNNHDELTKLIPFTNLGDYARSELNRASMENTVHELIMNFDVPLDGYPIVFHGIPIERSHRSIIRHVTTAFLFTPHNNHPIFDQQVYPFTTHNCLKTRVGNLVAYTMHLMHTDAFYDIILARASFINSIVIPIHDKSDCVIPLVRRIGLSLLFGVNIAVINYQMDRTWLTRTSNTTATLFLQLTEDNHIVPVMPTSQTIRSYYAGHSLNAIESLSYTLTEPTTIYESAFDHLERTIEQFVYNVPIVPIDRISVLGDFIDLLEEYVPKVQLQMSTRPPYPDPKSVSFDSDYEESGLISIVNIDGGDINRVGGLYVMDPPLQANIDNQLESTSRTLKGFPSKMLRKSLPFNETGTLRTIKRIMYTSKLRLTPRVIEIVEHVGESKETGLNVTSHIVCYTTPFYVPSISLPHVAYHSDNSITEYGLVGKPPDSDTLKEMIADAHDQDEIIACVSNRWSDVFDQLFPFPDISLYNTSPVCHAYPFTSAIRFSASSGDISYKNKCKRKIKPSYNSSTNMITLPCGVILPATSGLLHQHRCLKSLYKLSSNVKQKVTWQCRECGDCYALKRLSLVCCY